MKIGGVDPKTLSTEEILVLPRGEASIVFRAVGVPDYTDFNKLCPEPEPPKINKPKDGWVDHLEEPGYKDKVKTHGMRRLAWLTITSLEPSDIEWDKVDLDKPNTWTGWEEELKESGLNQVECQRVQGLVFQANSLDEAKLDAARESFLLGQQPVPSEYSGLSIAPETTLSGEPASE
jgi:hypothetical protein